MAHESSYLISGDHDVGRTFIFDVRNPLQPKLAASFTDLAGYMHSHSYLRLPNGHVLATSQHAHHDPASADFGNTGGLVAWRIGGGSCTPAELTTHMRAPVLCTISPSTAPTIVRSRFTAPI